MKQLCASAKIGAGAGRPTHVGFIGLGTMGQPMASNLLKCGVPLVVWNRTAGSAEALRSAGAVVAVSLQDVFDQSWATLLMLSDEDAVDQVLDRSGQGFAVRVRDRIIVNMGTFRPEYSLRLSQDIAAAGGRFVEAPVSGRVCPRNVDCSSA